MSGVIGAGAPDHPGYRSGAYYCAYLIGAATSNVAVAADTLYFYPIVVKRAVVMDGLALRVGTAVAATNVKMALFENTAGVAGVKQLIAACPTAGDMNETAGNTISLDFATPQKIIPGFYWGCALFNGIAQPYTHAGNVAMSGLADIMGAPNAGTYSTTATAATRIVSAGSTYAGGFPDVAPAPTLSQSNVVPIISWYAF
jgi:hypothetical protein